jgi:DnaK suppressor protein
VSSKPTPAIDDARARQLLARERERIESSLADSKRERDMELAGLDQHPSDDADRLQQDEVDDALDEHLREDLEALERAERRLEEGTYGLSIESGEPIPAQRLETIPWAERTPEEQERYERTHGRAL